MTYAQIRAAVQAAWKNRELVDTDTIQNKAVYHGVDPVSGYKIVMWFNLETCIVETAYPKGDEK